MDTYTRTVTGFVLGEDNSAFRHHYALAQLSCGHTGRVEVQPNYYACSGCNAAGRDFSLNCPCGYKGWRVVRLMDAHKPEDRVTQIGDVQTCAQCQREDDAIAWLRTLDHSTISHSRFRYGSYHFYRRDTSSPSGVLLAGSTPASPKIDAILRELRYSPLSPTEGFSR